MSLCSESVAKLLPCTVVSMNLLIPSKCVDARENVESVRSDGSRDTTKLFTCAISRIRVLPMNALDGNGCVTMDPAIESPSVLNGNWSPDGTMDNPGFESYEGTFY
ncbi:hypothetical protein GUITHDRAFT_165346 [Guillardia theta CCMP2712]|uniref:Uncharacterized protein n=1 Tax=Guillardia theta (strain CCMP2712) TaxID=905079 RepID=L1INW8_GUITC|nr:hypothetical protein GUITHDRAFT_165346 [Guillardia theta CCMP2712]EKX37953.1 hypothetical protein GUITHDRAFT_165346 [Guillardia theta CCMP2712]|eukprot:XP_005824933.1 hypothetical protein GUITHDRAFT_165346 [Guillardia theta CCMP2712]